MPTELFSEDNADPELVPPEFPAEDMLTEVLPDDATDPKPPVFVMIVDVLSVDKTDPELVFAIEDPVLIPTEVIVIGNEETEFVPPVLTIKDPVLVPPDVLADINEDPGLVSPEVIPFNVSDTELDFAVFVTKLLAKDEANPELVNPLFESEDPVLML